MSYVTQNFEDGKVLKAEHLNYIERNLVSISKNSDKVPGKANAFVAEASGNAVTFYPDEGSPLGVTAHIEPIQSGSGDPYPGGGKNLLKPYVVDSQYAAFQSVGDGVYTCNFQGNYILPERFLFKAGQTYTISLTRVKGTGNNPCIVVRNPSGSSDGQQHNYGTPSEPLTVIFETDTAWDIMIQSATVYGEVTVGDRWAIQIELGSVATPYAPYSNIRPISGHTGCDVTRSGKNLLNLLGANSSENPGITTGKEANSVTYSGVMNTSWAANRYVIYLPDGRYTLSAAMESDGGIPLLAVYIGETTNGTFAFVNQLNQSGSISFDVSGKNYVEIRPHFTRETGTNGEKWTIRYYNIQIESGSVATSYEPYRGANTYVMDFGRNLLRNEWVDGNTSVDSMGLRVSCKYTIPIVAGETYTLSSNNYTDYRYVINTDATLSTYPFKHTDGEPGSTYQECGNNINWVQRPITFTATANGYMAIVISKPGDAALTVSEVEKLKIQLERGSTATPYAPYNSAILAQTGGMVYGGTVDCDTGVLTVDRVAENITGDKVRSMTDTGTSTAMFVIGIANESFDGHTINDAPESSHYKGVKWYSNPWNVNNSISYYSKYNLRIRDICFDNVSAYSEYVNAQNAAGTPVQVCYKLATPTTIQLTPQEILALKGGNTVYTNAGPVTVEYNKSLSKAFEEVLAKLAALEAAAVNNV